jgi:AcrR family transcriptional regulator
MTTEMALSPRERILRATAGLLAEGGREAVTTRAVSEAAGVQSPTIYRQFGDMRGLLDEVASYGFSRYLESKVAREAVDDPVEDLCRAWDLHVEFGLSNPALYALMYGDPRPGVESAAASEARGMLRGLVGRIAEAGRLRVGVEEAAEMIEAAAVGVVLTLITAGGGGQGLSLSKATREAVLATVTTSAAPEAETGQAGRGRVAGRAVALKAVLPEASARFTPAERSLLSEWLDRLADPAL